MGASHYYTEQEVRSHQERLDDKELQELLDEVVRLEGKTWFVRKDQHRVRRFFRKPKTVTLYELLVECGGEWQIINFHGGECSINHDVSRAQVMTYLLGYIGGWQQATRAARV